MALVLNEEQRMLRESARDFLKSRAPVSHLSGLRDSLGALPALQEKLADSSDPLLQALAVRIGQHPGVHALLVRALRDEPPLLIRDGGVLAGDEEIAMGACAG